MIWGRDRERDRERERKRRGNGARDTGKTFTQSGMQSRLQVTATGQYNGV